MKSNHSTKRSQNSIVLYRFLLRSRFHSIATTLRNSLHCSRQSNRSLSVRKRRPPRAGNVYSQKSDREGEGAIESAKSILRTLYFYIHRLGIEMGGNTFKSPLLSSTAWDDVGVASIFCVRNQLGHCPQKKGGACFESGGKSRSAVSRSKISSGKKSCQVIIRRSNDLIFVAPLAIVRGRCLITENGRDIFPQFGSLQFRCISLLPNYSHF